MAIWEGTDMKNAKWFVMVSKTMRYDWDKDRYVPGEERIYKFASYEAAKRCYYKKDPETLKTGKVESVEVTLGCGNPDDKDIWNDDGWAVQDGCMAKSSG